VVRDADKRSPANASRRSRARGEEELWACRGICLPVRNLLQPHAAHQPAGANLANAMRSRWFGSMLAWILNTRAVRPGSVASITRLSAGCARGGGPYSASHRAGLHTYTLDRTTEIHRRQMPALNASGSNSGNAARTRSIFPPKACIRGSDCASWW